MAEATHGFATSETGEMSHFAHGIYKSKYSFEGAEEWPDTAKRVTENVLGALGYNEDDNEFQEIYELIKERKIMPGGRYLHATGRQIHQVNNCFLARAEDSREGWADLGHKAFMVLQTGGGLGVDYSDVRPAGSIIGKTGGTASGPLPLMSVINEIGRGVMAGGSRRSAIIATLNWKHGDIFEFIRIKDWPEWLRDAKADDMTVAAPMDMTNISVGLDDEFFLAYEDESHADHTHARLVYAKVCDKMLTTAEPGFTVDIGVNAGENLRNPCQPGWAKVLTPEGIREFSTISEGDSIWSETGWTKVVKKWSTGVKEVYKYETNAGVFYGTENHRVVSGGEKVEAGNADSIDQLSGINNISPISSNIKSQLVMDGLVLGDGSKHKASNNLIGLYIGDKDTAYHDSEISLHIGSHRQGISNRFWEVKTNIKEYELPKTYERRVPDRYLKATAAEVAAFLRGLYTANGCVVGKRVCLKASSKGLIEDVQLMLSSIGISSYVTTNKSNVVEFSNGTYECKQSYDINITKDRQKFAELIGFIQPYKTEKLEEICETTSSRAKSTYDITNVEYVSTEEVFDITVDNEPHTYWTGGVNVSNCGEITSSDDSDVCNLASLNMAKFDTIGEFSDAIRALALFQLAGTVYSDVPYDKVEEIRHKNRRLGIGIMGLHEWLVKRGYKYEPNEELGEWLAAYRDISRSAVDDLSFKHQLTNPVKVRAIAPTGCQSPDTLVTTTDGIFELSELGDQNGEQWQDIDLAVQQDVAGITQKSTRFFVNGLSATKKIRTSSGNTLEATPNHQYKVIRDGVYDWVRSDELVNGDLFVVPLNTYRKTSEPDLVDVGFNHHNERGCTLPLQMSEDLAWFLGVFNGDGSIHSRGIRIACNAKETHWQAVAESGKKLFGIEPKFEDNGRNCLSVYFNSSRLLRWLYVNGLDKKYSLEAEIPKKIRESSRASVKAYLDGYWFADGSASNSAKYIDTGSYKLAKQVQSLSRSVGSDCSIQFVEPGSGWGENTKYRVNFVKTKRRDETKEITSLLKEINLDNCTVDAVDFMEDSSSMTLDIEVPETNLYIANGVVSHNTISIIAETTSGIEPIFAVAYKRRIRVTDPINGDRVQYEYVIDPTAKRLIEAGANPEEIEDAYSLSYLYEKRIEMQAFIQKFVDHAISVTVNLPYQITDEEEQRDFRECLYEYLPQLRGFTAYPNGARGGQPLSVVPYSEAIDKEGVRYEESEERCVGGVCGS